MVEIDEGQLYEQVIKPDVPIQCDVNHFLREMIGQLKNNPYSSPENWLSACRRWKERYPVIIDEYLQEREYVNSYVFMDTLSDLSSPEDVLVTGNGLDCASLFQGFKVKHGQHALVSGWGSMGWDLPMAVGACVGSRSRTICVAGDGSMQWNIQELLTIKRYRLPVKIFVFNNDGYQSIRATQNNFFDGRLVGADYASGVANPDFARLASAYDLEYSRIANHQELERGIVQALASDGPAICEVMLSPAQGITPKASAFRRADGTFESRPLEDMAPFLPREEIWENMHQFDKEEVEEVVCTQ